MAMPEGSEYSPELKAMLAEELFLEAKEAYKEECALYQKLLSELPKTRNASGKEQVEVKSLTATQKFDYARGKLRFSEVSKEFHRKRSVYEATNIEMESKGISAKKEERKYKVPEKEKERVLKGIAFGKRNPFITESYQKEHEDMMKAIKAQYGSENELEESESENEE